MSSSRNVNEFIEEELNSRISVIETSLGADAISFVGSLMDGVDDLLRKEVENIVAANGENRKNKLVFILTTSGGQIEPVRRIVETLRRYYEIVDFVIPNYAYSAGTILAMSGDAIYMDHYSRLGPIDPQVQNNSGHYVPAVGYLEKYKGLMQKANEGVATTAEMTLLLQGFDQAELYFYEQAVELSVELLKEWLVKYKFKNWETTKTRGIAVTDDMKQERAVEIARILNDAKIWKVHGHGISKEVLTNELNLLIDDFGSKNELSDKIRNYNELLSDFMSKIGVKGVIHHSGTFTPFM